MQKIIKFFSFIFSFIICFIIIFNSDFDDIYRLLSTQILITSGISFLNNDD